MKTALIRKTDLGVAGKRVELFQGEKCLIAVTDRALLGIFPRSQDVGWMYELPGLVRPCQISEAGAYVTVGSKWLMKIHAGTGRGIWQTEGYFPNNAIPLITESRAFIPQMSKIQILNAVDGEDMGEFSLPDSYQKGETFLGIDSDEHVFQIRADKDQKAHLSMFKMQSQTAQWDKHNLPFDPLSLSNIDLHSEKYIGFSGSNSRTYYLIQKSDGSIALKLPYTAWFEPLLINDNSLLYINEKNALVHLDPSSNEKIWETPNDSRVSFQPLVSGNILIVSGGKAVQVLEMSSGKYLNRIEFPSLVKTKPLLANGSVQQVCEDGILYSAEIG